MFDLCYGREGRPITIVEENNYEQWLSKQAEFVRNWLAHSGFEGKGHRLIPGLDGQLDQVVVVVEDRQSVWQIAELALALPKAAFYLEGESEQLSAAALGWVLGQYQFAEYKKKVDRATLYINDETIVNDVIAVAKGVTLTRNLVNTPAGDMMPQHLSAAMQTLARKHNARFSEIVGDDLLKENFPTIHMVGRASDHEPRLLETELGR